MQKPNLVVLYGSRSPEHEISVITALQVMQNLSKEKYNIIPVYIDKKGEWILGNETFFKPELYKNLDELSNKNPKVTLNPDGTLTTGGVFAKKIKVDFVFPIFHGINGEDGTIQGLLEIYNLPYAMSGVTSSAVGMDKVLQKQAFYNLGLPVVKHTSFRRRDWQNEKDEIMSKIKKIKSPWFIKPVCGGSSIGINKAGTEKELIDAIEVAAFYDQKILVEEAVENVREINISILGNSGSELKVSACEEPISSGLLTFSDKYESGGKTEGSPRSPSEAGFAGEAGMAGAKREIPARIAEKTKKEIYEIARKAYEGLSCDGLARIDFLITDDEKKIYINEINTIPGSLSFYLWEKSGLKFPELLDKLIELGKERFIEKSKTNITFQTNILSNLDQKLGSKIEN